MHTGAIEPFTIHVPNEALDLLTEKIRLTRLPEDFHQNNGDEWADGPPKHLMEELLHYWSNGFDWRAQEAHLNSQPQFRVPIDVSGFGALKVHFVWKKSSRADATPLLLCHGWPGSFWEYYKTIGPLTEPEDSSLPAFHVVIPSIPGYVFSEKPDHPGFGTAKTAETFDKLMKRIGYNHYVAQGGDWGSMIVRQLSVLPGTGARAVHTNMPISAAPSPLWNPYEFIRMILGFTTGGKIGINADEIKGLEGGQKYEKYGNGYYKIQSTRPYTLAYAMHDSPVGLLAWLRDKLHVWTDSYPWTKDEVWTWFMLYWHPGPLGGFRYYKEFTVQEEHKSVWMKSSRVPLGLSYFPKEIATLPVSWLNLRQPVKFVARHKAGGHFAAFEKPLELVQDLRDFCTVILKDDPVLSSLKND